MGRRCLIPARTLPPCDLEWGHDGEMHANGGDGFYARDYTDEHLRRQAKRRARERGPHWKAGPEKPRTTFCWACGRRFHGRVHARVRVHDIEHDVHKDCVKHCDGAEVIGGSTTVKP